MANELPLILDADLLVRIAIQIGLFIASAFFSGSETALFSLSRMDLRKLRRERNPNAESLHSLLDQPRRLIIAVLCGNTLVNVAATANMTGILITLFGSDSAAWISTFVMVPLLLLFGEATPKTVAVSNPVDVSTRIVARPMSLWVAFVSPATSLVRKVSDRITTRIVGTQREPDNILHQDEFRSLVEEGVIRGELSATESSLIYNLLKAGNAEVVEVMTPRTRATFIDGGQPVPQVIEKFLKYQQNRIPVFKTSRDNVIGFLHSEDILEIVLDETDTSELTLEELMHTPVMVPPTKKIDEMFDYFQNHNVQAACVLNEFGGIDGFVTMSDVLAYIFGRPPTDIPDPNIVIDPEKQTFDVPGEMKLNEFNKLTNFGVLDPRMTTIAGAVFRALDSLPKKGDAITVNEVRFEVLETDGLRISSVRASQSPKQKPEQDETDSKPVKRKSSRKAKKTDKPQPADESTE